MARRRLWSRSAGRLSVAVMRGLRTAATAAAAGYVNHAVCFSSQHQQRVNALRGLSSLVSNSTQMTKSAYRCHVMHVSRDT